MSGLVSIKSGQLSVLRLALQAGDIEQQILALREKLDAAPGYFEGEALVLDVSACADAPDWQAMSELLQAAGLVVLGVHGPEALQQSAKAVCGWPALALSNPAGRRTAEGVATPEPSEQADSGQAAPAAQPATTGQGLGAAPTGSAPAVSTTTIQSAPEAPAGESAPVWRPTMVVERPLRSGQRIYAPHADLLVHGIVSHGAEVIADGHIHVYGPLRGRVMAGAQGDTNAQIYCTQLDAELIGIAGIYRTTDTPLPDHLRNKAVRIRLFNQSLVIEALDSSTPATSNSHSGRPA